MDELDLRLANIPAHADIVLLGFTGDSHPRDEVATGVFEANPPVSNWYEPSTPYGQYGYGGFHYLGLHAYLIRLASVPRIIEYVNAPALDADYGGGAPSVRF